MSPFALTRLLAPGLALLAGAALLALLPWLAASAFPSPDGLSPERLEAQRRDARERFEAKRALARDWVEGRVSLMEAESGFRSVAPRRRPARGSGRKTATTRSGASGTTNCGPTRRRGPGCAPASSGNSPTPPRPVPPSAGEAPPGPEGGPGGTN